MKISNYQVAFNQQHSKSSEESYNKQQRQISNDGLLGENSTNTVELSYRARMSSVQENRFFSQSQVKQQDNETLYQQAENSYQITQATLGADAFIFNMQLNQDDTDSLINPGQTAAYKDVATLGSSDSLSVTQGEQQSARIDIKEQHILKEKEHLEIGTQGRITTEDGREIDFMMKLSMDRSFSLEETLSITNTQRQLMDPLVINLHGGAASLTSTSFSFDLNADGITEDISFVGSGSGFLALDSNNDGKINDGRELFGTQGQDGFADLAQHDSDNNQWIDENDPIYQKLQVWTRDEQGVDQLISLKDAGVGAIYLGSSVGSFDLKDAENNLLGQVKRSGIFLTHQGEVASIQEIDLALHPEKTAAIPDAIANNLEKINQQVDEWRNNRAGPTFEFSVGAPPPPVEEDKENAPPTLLDLLFPPPGSKLAKKRLQEQEQNQRRPEQALQPSRQASGQSTEFSQSQSQTINQSKQWVNGKLVSQESLATEQQKSQLFTLDESEIDIMQRLNKKTEIQLTKENDQYAHLREIIEHLVKNELKNTQNEQKIKGEPRKGD